MVTPNDHRKNKNWSPTEIATLITEWLRLCQNTPTVFPCANEVAQSIVQRQQGLMERQEMPADRGMLIDFGSLQLIHMWMKNTYIPLDMIFLDEVGSISAIVSNTTPFSTTVILSPGPARAVLELNGGIVSRLRIKVGDKVFHRIFQP